MSIPKRKKRSNQSKSRCLMRGEYLIRTNFWVYSSQWEKSTPAFSRETTCPSLVKCSVPLQLLLRMPLMPTKAPALTMWTIIRISVKCRRLLVPQSDSGEISPTNIERRLTREEVLKMKKMTQNPSGLILTQRKKRVTSLVVRLRMNSKWEWCLPRKRREVSIRSKTTDRIDNTIAIRLKKTSLTRCSKSSRSNRQSLKKWKLIKTWRQESMK